MHRHTHPDRMVLFSVHVRVELEFLINKGRDQSGDFCACKQTIITDFSISVIIICLQMIITVFRNIGHIINNM